jgi:protein SCO1/2
MKHHHPNQLKRLPLSGMLSLSALALTLSMASPAEAAIVREGDPAPAVALIDETSQPVGLVNDRQTLVTFIFTRCAAVEFCPRMAKQFADVQQALKDDKLEGLRLLSISLDPEHDRPDMLKVYAEAVGADPAIWNFATADTATIDSLTHDFRVHRNREGGVLNHTLCTALIAPDGTITHIWRGNAWKTEEVLAAAGLR